MKARLFITPLLAGLMGLAVFLSTPVSSQADHERRYAGSCGHCGSPLYAYLRISFYGSRGPVFHWVTDYHDGCGHGRARGYDGHGFDGRGLKPKDKAPYYKLKPKEKSGGHKHKGHGKKK